MHSDYFEPEKLLAVGPAAKVYRGIELATGRKVLIKALLTDSEASYPLDREQLQLLAPSLMQIRHPQIAALITLLPTEDEFALVYEFMPGISGRAIPLEKQPSPADVKALAVQLMQALLVGEHLRMPHGDLKPSNLIITDHPNGGLFLQVQDWGLSKARVEQPVETLWFRAPELHRGAAVTSQSDLFTAGASLFFLATGAAPAQGNSAEDILTDLAAFDLIGSLVLMRPDIDSSFGDWLSWLLKPDVSQRPASIAQALDMLMRSMQTGFVYHPQSVPEMQPGSRTGPLIATPRVPTMLRPAVAPQTRTPKAAGPRPPQTSALRPASSVSKTTVVAKKRGVSAMVVVALFVNAVAIAAVLWFFRPFVNQGGWRHWFAQMNVPAQTAESASAMSGISEAAGEGAGLKARYIRVLIKGEGILNLAEVQVFSGADNIAYQGAAKQSSEEWDGTAELAIDGNTDGIYDHKSVTHTRGGDTAPSWELDLGRELTLNTIVIWNRTDKPEFMQRLKDFTVQVLSTQQSVLWEKTISEVPKPRVKLVVGE